ncbi:hypothetical protein [Aeromonas veronii]|uniref:hypothetical protein n=1 Tax=Aeromonas veronii TaxID=654 RepID=UPI001010CD63|nr:hypothetical protein [Aeromonas veronii]
MSNTTDTHDILTAAARDAAISEALLERMLNDGEGGELAHLVLHQVSRLRKDLERAAEIAHEQEVSESVVMLGKPEALNCSLLQQLQSVKGNDHEPIRA